MAPPQRREPQTLSANDVQLSNSTSARFSGAAQRSWMTGPPQALPETGRPDPAMPTPSSQKSPKNSEKSRKRRRQSNGAPALAPASSIVSGNYYSQILDASGFGGGQEAPSLSDPSPRTNGVAETHSLDQINTLAANSASSGPMQASTLAGYLGKPPLLDGTVIANRKSKIHARRELVAGMPDKKGADLEIRRLELLLKACEDLDYEFIFAAQLHAWATIWGDWSVCPPLKGITSEHIHGLAVLDNLLASNNNFERDAILWFSLFPDDVLTLKDESRRHEALYIQHHVLPILPTLVGWHSLLRTCNTHRTLPLKSDIQGSMGIESPLLQQAAFRVLARLSWRGERDDCMQVCERIFIESQASQVPDASVRASESFRRALAVHASHSNPVERPLPHTSIHASQGVHRVRTSTGDSSALAGGKGHRSTPTFSPTNNLTAHAVFNLPTFQSQRSSTLPASQVREAQTSTLGGSIVQLRQSEQRSTVQAPQDQRSGSQHPHDTHGSNPSNISLSQELSNQAQHRAHPQVGPVSPVFPNPPSYPSPTWSPRPANSTGLSGSPAGAGQFRAGSSSGTPLPSPSFSSDFRSFQTAFSNIAAATQGYRQNAASIDTATLQGPPIVTTYPPLTGTSFSPSTAFDENSAKDNFFRLVTSVDRIPSTLSKDSPFCQGVVDLDASVVSHRADQVPLSSNMRPIKGSAIFRFRAIRRLLSAKLSSEADWVTTETCWPQHCGVTLNGQVVKLRQKSQNPQDQSKDLPSDVTSMVKAGANEIKMSAIGLRGDHPFLYMVAIETIHIHDENEVRSSTKTLDYQQGLARITSRFKSLDPDVEVVTGAIIVNITDPFTARLHESSPVRAKSCRHDQCFDLDTFLRTRTADKIPNFGQLCHPDGFKCPICGADARPSNLVVDEFFSSIVSELKKSGGTGVKTITIDDQGLWKIQEQDEKAAQNGKTPAKDSASVQSPLLVQGESIEISDDEN